MGRRKIDAVLQDDFLTHLADYSDEDLEDIQERLAEAEAAIAVDRKVVYESLEVLLKELARRYRDGLADPAELIRSD